MKNKAIYAGTFDPITLGHMDLVKRGAAMFEMLVLAVVRKGGKSTLFTAEERAEMVKNSVADLGNVEVAVFDGLLVDYAAEIGADVLIRGLRSHSDFEYEQEMALTNRKLAPSVDTLFMMPGESVSYISSTLVREIASLGGDIGAFVPPCVKEQVLSILADKRDQ